MGLGFTVRSLRWFALGLLTGTSVRAEVKPAAVFTDHMVLQRECPVPIWGTAAPGEGVVVEFAGQRKETKAGTDGKWRIDLDAMPANSTGHDLTVVSGNPKSKIQNQQFSDVLVGEVWLCSGQSNMAWTVREKGVSVENAVEEVAAANFPLIRQLKIPKRNTKEPVEDFQAEWTVCSPETVGSFTGVGYFFARELFQKLRVPVGIINSSYGGTPIEAWVSGKTFQSDPACSARRARFAETEAKWPEILAAYRAETEAWEKESATAKAAGAKFEKPKPRQPVGPGHPYSPVTVYNAMLHPLIPYALRGVIWYQGEANVKYASEYEAMLSALITQWRATWKQGTFPFYFVQVPNFKGYEPNVPDWPWMREAQAGALDVPNTGMVVTIDVGNPDDPHPRNKQDVGRRLALLALANTYQQDVGEISGPVLSRTEQAGAGLRLSFDHAAGLYLKDPPTGFEIAGSDRRFVPASAIVKDGQLHVSAPEVREPAAVRYAWSNAPVASLFNSSGLPAAPFRTDDWPREDIPIP